MTERAASIFRRAQACLEAMAPNGPSTALQGAIEGCLAPGGKRARMVLILESGDALGLPSACTEMLAASIEFYHVASLALDDLPMMDDATLRHGRPCVHLAHGEANAVLAALSLISRSYLLAEMAFAHLPLQVRVRAHVLMEDALGARGLSGGQAEDLAFNRAGRALNDPCNQVRRIALKKTGGLIRLCLHLPALAAGASDAEMRSLSRLSVYWSLCYQMIDDLHDIESSTVEAGKTTGRDATLGRPNLALEAGMDEVRRMVARLESLAAHELASLISERPAWAHLHSFHKVVTFARQAAAAAA